MTNLAAILSKPATDIKPPPLVPMGSYHALIIGLPTPGQSSKQKTDFLEFSFKLVAPLDDVDPEAVETFNAEVEGGLAGRVLKEKFYITENSVFMLKQMLENAGIEAEGKSLSQMIDESPNADLVIFINHEASQDGQRFFARVTRTAPLEG